MAIGEVMADDYNASSIKVIMNEEAEDRWIWKKAEHLAIRYKKPANWINDGLTACYYCNVDLDWFEQRYLAKTTTENKPEVLAAYLELRDDMG
jgi:hypothetical protein